MVNDAYRFAFWEKPGRVGGIYRIRVKGLSYNLFLYQGLPDEYLHIVFAITGGACISPYCIAVAYSRPFGAG